MKAGNLNIRWHYSHSDKIGTACTISMDSLPFPVAEGMALCTKHDHFCKDTGRKLSLARAMDELRLPKEERTVIWELYRNTKLGGRW